MALLRSDVETILTKRVGAYLVAVAMNGTYPNAALADPIAWALRMLGFTPAAYTTVADSDLVNVSSGQVDALFDLAELRTLESVQQNLTKVTVKAGPVQENLGELGDRLLKLIPEKRKSVAAMHGYLLAHSLGEGDKRPVKIQTL